MDAEKNNAVLEKAENVLREIFSRLGLNAELTGEVSRERLTITIASDEAGRIIGRKGQNLESLQLLLNRIVFKGEEEAPRIYLNIDGYSRDGFRGGNTERRNSRHSRGDGDRRSSDSGYTEEQLRQRAIDAGKEVKKWGEPVQLPKMNAHDRRIIHITLQDDPALVTESAGEGALKRVVVSLKKED